MNISKLLLDAWFGEQDSILVLGDFCEENNIYFQGLVNVNVEELLFASKFDNYGDGDGDGYGCSYSLGNGIGNGYGYGDGDGNGYGYGGYGYGSGNGYGYGDGYGNGYGDGYGDGYDKKEFYL